MAEGATPIQTAAFLTALRAKGETEDELFAFAAYLRERARAVAAPENAVDVCGTGGDGSNSFNVGTATAFVVSACGVPVAKHGNRSITSACGSADVLEALGARIALSPRHAESVLKETGITFLFAPQFHPALKTVGPVRKELGFRTIFNLLGPLLNPARVKRQLLGVYDPAYSEKIARVLQKLGSEHALVVHCGGMDELALHDKCTITELAGGTIKNYELSCTDFGLRPAPLVELRGGNSQENALILQNVLRGEDGAHRDAVLLNAGATLYVSGKAGSIASGITRAAEAIDSGSASDRLKSFIAETRKYVPPEN